MGTAEGEAPPASLPPLRPALLTVAQILLLEIPSQLNQKAQRGQRGVIQHLVTGAPSGRHGGGREAVRPPGPGPPSWEGDLGACRPPSAGGDVAPPRAA